MLQTVAEFEGVPWDGRTAFEHWVEDDLKLPLQRGYYAIPFAGVELGWWQQRGIRAAFYDLIGAESLAGMYVGELAPGKSSERVRQLSEEVIYVLSGNGAATIVGRDGETAFEWQAGSLFAVPMNSVYQLHNGSGQEPARFISVNTLPVVFNLFRDAQFIFETDWDFKRWQSRSNASEAVLYKPDARHDRTAVNLYETQFVPDINAVPLSTFAERGEGARTAYFELANSSISAHLAGFAGGQFVNPHRHGPSAFVFILQGTGYSLMWQDPTSIVRFDWPLDSLGVIVPPNFWWHGHFITSPNAFHLAIKLRSRKFPLNHLYDKTHKLVSEGGTVLRYSDLEPGLRSNLWDTYQRECAKNGLTAHEPV
ncbi:MAG TPA: cupin domain-containing protein [Chloroflexota bacterium]|nr:cupin domain-containing protein [Chloroflexota bacterium]